MLPAAGNAGRLATRATVYLPDKAPERKFTLSKIRKPFALG
ncbi:hypothetical protein PLANPX_0599 [Lacipirellula parvula]|uniref:Uncharacterized protein n=1 Tax=Lacipirellula parvula TaxID=2650471 RepID=A0A5K7X5A2_9BACT|nr:hypothetical protein PLANPX_0599 [Lacipirellula parvula]